MSRGFTLIELLVAMALLAILAGLGGRGLVAVAEGHRRLEEERRHWDGLSAFFSRLGDDVGQVLPRLEVAASGQRQPVWRNESKTSLLEYARPGLNGPTRVAWRLTDGRIETAANDQAWLPVLNGVRRLEWRHMDEQGAWLSDWMAIERRPRALMVRLEMENGMQVERRFATP